jgi:hypothetical protein
MWFGGDQRTNITKTHGLKEIGLCVQLLIATLHSTSNTVGRTYVI